MEDLQDLWPCLGKKGLSVFTITADQRYLLGEGVFLNTHFPISLYRFPPNRSPEVISEAEVLERLLDASYTRPGNRVFILYGAAGSGKSELMRWLQIMISKNDPVRAEVTRRIPSTGLNVLQIAEQFHHLLTERYFSAGTYRRWEEARCKPRTLSKLLLLVALERCLNSDEQVNAFFYRLLPWIEPRITRVLEAEGDTPAELFTREDFDQLKAETSLPVPIEYEPFRHHLLTAFQEYLLEGFHFPDMLRLIAEEMNRRGVRPLLMIDDLVQSINLFATDLMDYFLTLDSGNWDVVVGLTPAALEASNRGRELLNRITYLDTIDDRVEKLWLSDVQGHESYFLTEETCSSFAARYMDAYRACNGRACVTCPQRQRCLQLDVEEGLLLAPFNKSALLRLFRGLPEGKGKVRQFVRALCEVLESANTKADFLKSLAARARTDFVVEAEDWKLARLAELYGPMVTTNHRVTLSSDLLSIWGFPSQTLTLSVEPLGFQRIAIEAMPGPTFVADDPGRIEIKNWLEEGKANRQSLIRLRQGVARWLRTVYPHVEGIFAEGIAVPHSVLRWQRVYLGVHPPVILEGVDEGKEGIFIAREIGLAAFRLYEYATATGGVASSLIAVLAKDERLVPLLLSAIEYRRKAREQLEVQLGMEADQLALALYVWLLILEGPPARRPPGFTEGFWARLERAQSRLCLRTDFLDQRLQRNIGFLFEDFFKMRDNVYNGPHIARILDGRAPEELLTLLARLPIENLDRDYWLGQERLSEALQKIVSSAKQILAYPSADGASLSPEGQALWDRLRTAGEQGIPLDQVAVETLRELQYKEPGQYRLLRISLLG